MKGSRKFIIYTLLLIAFFCCGAVLGSLISETLIYAVIAAVSIAIVVLILYGYYGHKKENLEEE